jgi:nucleotide-binding universal stress UspA family protein
MLLPEEDEERKRQLAEAMAALKARGVAAKAVERRGDAAEAIVYEAQQEGAELIVLGTRGLNAAKRWLMGSVSTRVVQHAPCNVLVVR